MPAACPIERSTTLDLDAFEALPDQLHSGELLTIASQRAHERIKFELNVLGDNGVDGRSSTEMVLDLRDRAHYYGLEVEVDALLEGLASESDQASYIDTQLSAPLVDGGNESPDEIFGRFRS